MSGLAPAPLVAQMSDMPGMHHQHATTTVTAGTKRQIDSVVKAIRPLGAPGAASAAGFQPAFGWIPTMGEHWVARGLMMNGRQTDRGKPSQLMFSKIAGRDSLVGAAYGYVTAVGDTVRPELFDGAPAWHEHRDLVGDGLTLVMLHVWFVPSPDGPFAGTNPNLPFWAAGLAAPDSARMHDAAFSTTVRRAALALSEIVDTKAIFPRLEGRPDVRPVLVARRDSIRALVAEMQRAEQGRDRKGWDRGAAQLAAQWDAIYATYLGSVRTPEVKARMERFVATMLGQHHE